MDEMNAIELAIKYAKESERLKLLVIALEAKDLEKVIEYLRRSLDN